MAEESPSSRKAGCSGPKPGAAGFLSTLFSVQACMGGGSSFLPTSPPIPIHRSRENSLVSHSNLEMGVGNALPH